MTHHNSPDDELQVEGTKDRVEGAVKEGWGKLTGDTSDELSGKAENTWGKVQQGAADVMDEIGDAIDPDRNKA